MPRYRYFDLSIASDVALQLPFCNTSPDIDIRLMPPLDLDLAEGYWSATVTDASVDFLWEEAGHFIMTDGNKITIHPKRGCSDGMLIDSLLGECLGTILIQRGIFCLHASAVDFDGTGLVFTGTGGQGKSTLAWLSTRLGAGLLTDEIVVIEGRESPILIPGPPIVKVRDQVIEENGSSKNYPKAFPSSEKRLITLTPVEKAVPLQHVLFLRPGDALELEPMSSRQVAFALMENTFAAHLTDSYGVRFVSTDGEAELFKRCAELAGRITPHALVVPPAPPTPIELKTVLEPLMNG